MNDDQLLLASAYFDGELDAGERARAEADIEVMAEVARLGDVRERLRAADPPDPARREAAITTALAGTAPSAAIAPLRRRRVWLPAAAAAAVIAIAIAGVAVLANRSGGDDSDTALLSATATTAAANEAAPNRAAATLGESATTAAGGSATATAGSASAPAEASTNAPAAAPTTTVAVLDSATALGAFAARIPPAQLDAATTPPTCAGGRFVGRAEYRGDSGVTPVEVFVQDRAAIALDATTCSEVARAALP